MIWWLVLGLFLGLTALLFGPILRRTVEHVLFCRRWYHEATCMVHKYRWFKWLRNHQNHV